MFKYNNSPFVQPDVWPKKRPKEWRMLKLLPLKGQFTNFEPIPFLKGIGEYINTLKRFFNPSLCLGEIAKKTCAQKGTVPFRAVFCQFFWDFEGQKLIKAETLLR